MERNPLHQRRLPRYVNEIVLQETKPTYGAVLDFASEILLSLLGVACIVFGTISSILYVVLIGLGIIVATGMIVYFKIRKLENEYSI